MIMTSTPNKQKDIHLVTVQGSVPSSGRRERPADRGGQEQGLREFFGLESVKVPDFKSQLERALAELNVILDVTSSATFPIPKMEFESMEVGLAISAKGSIGIVTAGVDASLRLTFKKV
jgi:hypothetical protein